MQRPLSNVSWLQSGSDAWPLVTGAPCLASGVWSFASEARGLGPGA